MDEETREIVDCFVLECREALDEVEPMFIGLEGADGPPPPELLARSFRLFHSVKGNAGYLHFASIERVTHRAETLIDLIQKGQVHATTPIVELLCRVLDVLRARIDAVAESGIDTGGEDACDSMVHALEAAAAGDLGPLAPAAASAADWESEPGYSMGDLVGPFIVEGRELLDTCEAALLGLEQQPADREQVEVAFRALHSFKGNAGFLGFGDFELLAHTAENLLDAVKEGAVPANLAAVSALLSVVDALRAAVARLPESASIPDASQRVKLLETILQEGKALQERTRLGAVLVGQGVVPQRVVDEALAAGGGRIGETLQRLGTVGPRAVASALAEQAERRGVVARPQLAQRVEAPPAAEAGPRAEAAPERKPSQSLRVDVAKLDMLMDLVGELIIAETAVMPAPGAPMRTGQELATALAQLDRVTRSLQDVAMSLRMVPVESTFRKMIRLARDVAAKQGKQVTLRIVGEETEVDKTVAEVIADPLVHLLRNGVDHGLETPAERIAAGKPAEGVVELSARHVGGEVWIQVRDDGRGIARDRVLAKAISRGLVDAARAETLSDADVYAFVFEAGFSTAAEVTDISGRGVGMDVVKRQIETVKGRVDVASSPGVGTTFTLRIPLTLAIIEGMLVRVGDASFTIPLLNIRESVVPRSTDVTVLSDGQEVVRIRGQVIPVVRLHSFYRISPQHERLEQGILVVVEDGGQAVCLFVDELVGQRQTVIKGLSGYLGDVRGLSGCTVLGDGRISLILDVMGLLAAVARGS